MSRFIFSLLLLFPVLACNDAFQGQCICTLKACFEGVSIQLILKPDTTEYKGVAVAIAYGDTVEAASTEWGFLNPDTYTFTSPRLRSQRPSHIMIRIAYTRTGTSQRIELDTALAWQSSVCNHCSGNSSTCKDDMAHTAAVGVDLNSRI